jgi:hypothetical protein
LIYFPEIAFRSYRPMPLRNPLAFQSKNIVYETKL